MAQVNSICPICGERLLIEREKEADICPKCNQAFITEKAIELFSRQENNDNQVSVKRKKHVFRSLGKGLLMVLECIGYLFYVLFFIWLFVDITDDLKKK